MIIKYEKKHKLINPCPYNYNVYDIKDSSVTMIGSYACTMGCKYNNGIDYLKGEINCLYEIKNKREQKQILENKNKV